MEKEKREDMTEWYRGPHDLEYFEFHNWRWEILGAKEIAEHRTPVQVSVDEFVWLLDDEQFDELISEEEQARLALNHRAVDLSHPVIVCDLTPPAAALYGHPRILIDGWHRVALASETGVPTLPAVILTADDGLSISHYRECYGCEHHSHVQFSDSDTEYCTYFCDACQNELRETQGSQSLPRLTKDPRTIFAPHGGSIAERQDF